LPPPGAALRGAYVYDSESGLYYCSARSYDPATRQWISKDPEKADGEESAYQYCAGEPVSRSDSSATYWCAAYHAWSHLGIRAAVYVRWYYTGYFIEDVSLSPVYFTEPWCLSTHVSRWGYYYEWNYAWAWYHRGFTRYAGNYEVHWSYKWYISLSPDLIGFSSHGAVGGWVYIHNNYAWFTDGSWAIFT
jgi:RHS repeat-associated protein